MLPTGFEPAVPASERPQTHALDRVVTWIGGCDISWYPLSAFDQLRSAPRPHAPIIIGESAPRSLRRQTAFRRTAFRVKDATVDINILYVWGRPRTTWRPHRVVFGSLIQGVPGGMCQTSGECSLC